VLSMPRIHSHGNATPSHLVWHAHWTGPCDSLMSVAARFHTTLDALPHNTGESAPPQSRRGSARTEDPPTNEVFVTYCIMRNLEWFKK
jgi:hypothetical protein